MLKTSKMMTITVPKATFAAIRSEAKKRNETISGILRKAFDTYITDSYAVYTDEELAQLLKKDRLPRTLQQQLDRAIRHDG